MKSVDGVELRRGHYYYLDNGQCVCLDNLAITPEGKEIYSVYPFYEGEATGCDGNGGQHNEYNVPFEVEGEPMLVTAIYGVAPQLKLCEVYARKAKDVEALALTSGHLRNELNIIKQSISLFTRKKIEEEREYRLIAGKTKTQVNSLNKLNEEIGQRRQELSELKDSISTLKNEDVSSLVSKTELQRLNKRDFEIDCLEAGGVDNWAFYDESLKEFHLRYPEG